jgi:ankyrin repeat protein
LLTQTPLMPLLLLANGGADLEARKIAGLTALMWASYRGHLAIVKLLSNKGTLIWAEYNEWAQKLLHNNISV